MNYMERSVISQYLNDHDKITLLSLYNTENDIILISKNNKQFYRKVIELAPKYLLTKYINIKINKLSSHEQAYIYALAINDTDAANIISTKLGPIPERALEIAGNNTSVDQLKLVQEHMGIKKDEDYYKIFQYIQRNSFMHLRYICNAKNIKFDDDGLLSIKLAIQHNNSKIINLIHQNTNYDRMKLKSIMNYEFTQRGTVRVPL